jgi:hypothetical protein
VDFAPRRNRHSDFVQISCTMTGSLRRLQELATVLPEDSLAGARATKEENLLAACQSAINCC